MLDIVVPAYNEKENILSLFEAIDASIKAEKNVFIVYDFDEDNTIPVVNENKDKYSFGITPIKNTYGRGVCNAIKYGINHASNEMVLIMMADLSDRLEDVDKMVYEMKNGADVVCGSRYMKGGRQHGGGFLKTKFSRMAGLSLHWLTRIPTHDVTNSFKMYSRQLLDNIELESTGGFEVGLEIAVKAYVNGYKVVEIPSEWFDREQGESRFHMWRWMPKYLKWYFYCIRKTWFKRWT